MDSSTVKSVTASWHVLFLLVFIFFSDKSIGTHSGVHKGSSALASPPGILPHTGYLAAGIVGHSSNRLQFQGGNSGVEGRIRKLRRKVPLVPPSPKPNGSVSYVFPISPPPPHRV
ncbi:hypothetical protein SUGI_0198920 [Cryptomeria japonica]|nr:hypothetical protein SUGI_0198920 [Cryptomeria japonica]